MHLHNHVHHSGLRSNNTLHVVGVLSNPVRYHSRYRLAREWVGAMEATPNVELHIVETAFGDRHHEVTEDGKANHLMLRTRTEIWNKENAINLGVRHLLPRDWKYLAWIDMDVFFRDPNWAQETMQQLQHFPILQPWQQCTDLGFRGNVMQTHQSLGWLCHAPKEIREKFMEPALSFNDPYRAGHTGYAWACTRAFWEQVYGLLDHCILGSADNHMGRGCLGETIKTIHGKMHKSFIRLCLEWQSRAVRLTHNQIGYVNGRIEHSFHGPKSRRFYGSRWQILIDHLYDPDHDLLHDEQGLIQLAGKPELEQAIRSYNRARLEDSIEEY